MKQVYILVTYSSEPFLVAEGVMPKSASGQKELVGIIPFDVYSSEEGFKREDYYEIKYPVSEQNEFIFAEQTINEFGLTKDSHPLTVMEAWYWQGANVEDDSAPPPPPDVVVLPS